MRVCLRLLKLSIHSTRHAGESFSLHSTLLTWFHSCTHTYRQQRNEIERKLFHFASRRRKLFHTTFSLSAAVAAVWVCGSFLTRMMKRKRTHKLCVYVCKFSSPFSLLLASAEKESRSERERERETYSSKLFSLIFNWRTFFFEGIVKEKNSKRGKLYLCEWGSFSLSLSVSCNEAGKVSLFLLLGDSSLREIWESELSFRCEFSWVALRLTYQAECYLWLLFKFGICGLRIGILLLR